MFEEFGKSLFLLFGTEEKILVTEFWWEIGKVEMICRLTIHWFPMQISTRWPLPSPLSTRVARRLTWNMAARTTTTPPGGAWLLKHQNPTASDLFFVFCFFSEGVKHVWIRFLDVCQAKYGCSWNIETCQRLLGACFLWIKNNAKSFFWGGSEHDLLPHQTLWWVHKFA